ncbi:hypothetical protein AB4347_15475 [Vibrio breoganii]|uniref:hypothetical protein n=1 Tax=Vibrio breoganii TaxID=553239 RepID=UPI000C85DF44|nr:hypothetical protein [Vibrio breoganii]PMG04001.1 hypothetical protein BCV08_06660 [Vibrio breoganii]PMG38446.1 hypothetical protein BCU93_01765 [Vibrio breoganii]PMG89865.1 hypothetical protein BCU80_15930 [Vibrio breoganii]PMK59311.1 hypothetical protein BCT98_05985 [Vibrio breoganii]PMK69128.1 hypothetical protein BCT94_02330 [Vibrio breoganii]
MKFKAMFASLLLTLVFTGCAKTTVVTSDQASKVQVLYTVPSQQQYEELGLVSTQTGQTIFHDRSNEGMLIKLQEKAYKMGADAIIVRSVDESTWGFVGDNSTGYTKGKATAVAIKFKQSPRS